MIERSFREIPGGSPMQGWRVPVVRFQAAKPGPRAYLQAALHADEQPGVAVIHELAMMLSAADAKGRLRGEIVLVPYANPIGLHQIIDQRHLGRLDIATGINFNRKFPMRRDRASNSAPEPAARVAAEALKTELLALAEESDIVLDLHCDKEAALYIYIHAVMWPAAADLPAWLGAATVLLWSGAEEGGTAFEEAVTDHRLADLKTRPFVSATVELRGQSDVDPELARADARGLFGFLAGRGLIAGESAVAPAWDGIAVRQDHVVNVDAPAFGTLLYEARIGERLKAGQPIARILAAPGDPAGVVTVAAPVDGLLFIRGRDRLARVGQTLASLVADKPAPASAAGRTLSP
jgi:uncharacterized protein